MGSEYIAASQGGADNNGHEGYHELSSEEPSAGSSANPSRPSSPGGSAPQKNRGRVRFNSTSEANDFATNQKSSFPLQDKSISPHTITPLKNTKSSPIHSRNSSVTNLLRRTPEHEKADPFADPTVSPVFKPKPSLLRKSSYSRDSEDVGEEHEKAFSALAAQERAQRIATLVGSHSAPASRRNSFEDEDDEEDAVGNGRRPGGYPVRIDDIPLVNMDVKRAYDGAGIESDEEEFSEKSRRKGKATSSSEAHKLVRQHTRKLRAEGLTVQADTPGLRSGQVTPTEEQHLTEEYVPRPAQYRGGVLSSLLKLYNAPHGSSSRRSSAGSAGSPSYSGTRSGSVVSSGVTTPRTKQAKWYHQKNQSQDTLAGLIEASAILGAPGGASKKGKPSRPGMGKRTGSGNIIDTAMNRLSRGPRLEDEIRITIHIAETLSRQKYLLKLCRVLMSYGAPTHRLESYMKMSARVLEIEGQFLYIPGCMIISFDDASTHTTEVKLVKSSQGVNLGKLKDIWEIYKEVVHDVIGVEEATQRLDNIISAKPKHNPWFLVVIYGFASATVAPFGTYPSNLGVYVDD